MLFRKKITPNCTYCSNCTPMDNGQYLCIKKGIVDSAGKCRRFRYDPFKRTPVKPKSLDFSKYEQEDYSL